MGKFIKIILILFLSFLSTQGFASPLCSHFLSDTSENSNDIAQEAVSLLQSAENELAIDMQFRGYSRRVIDLEFSEKLETMAIRIENHPGENQVFVDLFNELSSIFAGRSSIAFYSRKQNIGYDNYRENTPGLADEAIIGGNYWDRVHSLSKFKLISPGVYLNTRSIVYMANEDGDVFSYLPFIKNSDLIKKLLQRRIGKGYARKNTTKSTPKLTVYDFEILAKAEDNDYTTYKVTGRKLVNNETKESLIIVMSIVKPLSGYEARYYSEMSKADKIEGFKVKIEKELDGYNEIVVHPRIVYKVKHKHGYEPQELKALLEGEISDLRTFGGLNHFYMGYIKERKIRIILAQDPIDSKILILKTVYPFSVSDEEVVKDIEGF